MKIEYKDNNSNSKLLEDILNYDGKLLLGIPEDTSARGTDKDGKPVYNNAQILALMEAGSPEMNIPSREVLRPVIEKHKEEIMEDFILVYNYLLSKEEDKADAVMERLSQEIEMWCKSYFNEDNGWEPNSPITVNGGWMRNKISGKPVYVEGKHSDHPLIDTGELRKALRCIFVKEK